MVRTYPQLLDTAMGTEKPSGLSYPATDGSINEQEGKT